MRSTLTRKQSNTSLKIVHCRGALDSFEEALKSVIPHKKQGLIRKKMQLMMERLGKGLRLCNDDFPQEGKIQGTQNKHFYAFKKLPVRAYCWFSDKYPKTVFISHYIHKDYQKLSKKEIQRVSDNYKRIEVENDAE